MGSVFPYAHPLKVQNSAPADILDLKGECCDPAFWIIALTLHLVLNLVFGLEVSNFKAVFCYRELLDLNKGG
ncbi:hypothetical protein HMPREF0530_1314 [Lacticaseibacillus paracasei subsp. paracasei ATCC 25302 = DSM 5622 = JCM 8130]|nr:hypothetical protein HMPREF0530_1314 [Lacticaseibacillus paracasei subsp. paracasei ATCC 25302 = DSM 5622 = JCM 8130]